MRVGGLCRRSLIEARRERRGTVGPVLVLKKKGVSSSYRLFDGDREVALVRSDGSWGSGSLELDGRTIEFCVVGADLASFTASVDGDIAASALRPTSSVPAFDVSVGSSTLHMIMHRIGQKPFDVTDEGGHEVGVVALRGAMGRRIEIDLPADISIAAQLLCGWLATRHYNKAAQVRIVQ